MYSCLVWAAVLTLTWITVLAWHALGGEPSLLANGLAYAAVGILAMALVARCAPAWHAAFRRICALLTCAVLSGIDIGFSGYRGETGQKLFFAALLGIAMVVLASKHVPAGLRRYWLGER